MHSLNKTPGLAELVEWREIARRWPFIAAAAAAAALMAALYLAFAAPVYEAETRVVIQNIGLDLASRHTGTLYDKEFLSTQAEVISSPATISRSLENLPPLLESSQGNDPVTAISEKLRVSPLANTDIVRVTFQHSDPEHAVERLKSIIESYRAHLQATEQDSTSSSVELLTRRSSELETQITEMQVRLRTAQNASIALGTEDNSRAGSPLLQQLLTRWAVVQSQLASIESSIVADGPLLATSIDEFSPEGAHELQQLQDELTLARVQVEELSRIYGPVHPERIAAEQRLASLTSQLQTREAELRSSLTAHESRVKHERDLLNELLAREQSRLEDVADARLEEQQLLADLSRMQELHTSTVQTLEALRLADRTIAEGRGSIRVEVLDAFVVPTEPIWPLPGPLLAMATILGALLGLVVMTLDHARIRYGIVHDHEASQLNAHGDGVDAQLLAAAESLQSEVRSSLNRHRQDAAVAGEPS